MDDLTLCSCDDGGVVDEKESWRIKIGTLWRIRADMRYEECDMPD